MMAETDVEGLLQEIGAYLAKDRKYPLEGTLLYSEVGDGFVSAYVYQDAGNHVAYHDAIEDPVMYKILALWKAQGLQDDECEVIEYVIRNGEFRLSIQYLDADEIFEHSFVLRDEAVRRHFGDKPVLYPPPPDFGDVQTYDL